MTTVMPIQCYACRRLDRSRTLPFSSRPAVSVCAAFPGGIPDAVLFGADHRAALGGEADGLVFAAADSDEARTAFGQWGKTFDKKGDAGEA